MGTQSFLKIKLRVLLRKIVRPRILLILLLVFIALPAAFTYYYENVWEFRDHAPQRGASVATQDIFGDAYTQVRYLDQGWKDNESLWFYTTSQGSDLLPYDFFLSLQSAGSDKPFRSLDNIQRWRYLPQEPSVRNPDGLPVGFVKDSYKGREYLGFSCAACHTGQVNYKGTALRIDGGQTLADMDGFMHDLAAAINATAQLDAAGHCKVEVCTQFVERVLARGNYKTADEVTTELAKYRDRIAAYTQINASTTPYGYARLDAFGRIFNRVLEHVIQKQQLADMLPEVFQRAELQAVREALKPVLEGPQEDHVIERALPLLSEAQRQHFLRHVFNSPNAPVSYPFLWDIPQHDYVQWNGLAANAGLGPVGRNAGEVVGVFGTLDWSYKPGFSLSSIIGGQPISTSHISYESSVRVHNLRRIEAQLRSLQSPLWPEDVLGSLDKTRVERGEGLFDNHCAACHAAIDRKAEDRRIVANMTMQPVIGTDPQMALNSVTATGFSGILRNQYVATLTAGDILIDKKAPVAALLTKATTGVVADPYPSGNLIVRGFNWLYDLATAFFTNEIKPSIKNGNYDPDTTANPYASLVAYKGRALNGIWATAPYLHNGSIPTLYDILLPEQRKGDPAGEEYRPTSFVVGSREYDPVKGGYLSQGYAGFVFDTKLPANSNAGHEYGTIHDTTLAARGLKPLSREERLDLLEYMKSL
ncbi:di-heme-cytochrome C peroxidase [Uliginosibacterium sediminicola]|uniref:Di-heme-cytochrome C peroxidase n=1 Tax=Uliginosibacterium sediminicola TaxID=2024550 RepID=A0ABU9YT95_9RHOO